jgi:hypothetical protein
MKVILIAIVIVTLFSEANVSAQTPEEDVKNKVSPTAYAEKISKELKDKAIITDEVSAPMAQILQVATDALGEETNTGTDCKRSAAIVGYEVAFNEYSVVGLNGLLEALKKAATQIYLLYGTKMKEAAEGGQAALDKFKEKLRESKEKLDEYLKEQRAKLKPETYITRKQQGECDVVIVSTWNRPAGTYEITMYGFCDCKRRSNGTQRGSSLLGTFAITMSGTATIGADYRKESPVLNVGTPKVSVFSNCDQCKDPAANTVTPPVTVTPVDPCTLKPPCPECKPITDEIAAGCKRLAEIDADKRRDAGVYPGMENTVAYIKGQLARLMEKKPVPTEQIEQLRQEIKDLERKMKLERFRSYGVGLEELDLKAKLQKLATDLKECAKSCGSGKAIVPPKPVNPKLDKCLVGTWKLDQTGVINIGYGMDLDLGGLVFSVEADGTGILDYSGTKPNITRRVYGGGGEAIVYTTTAVGRMLARIESAAGAITPGEPTQVATFKETSSEGQPRILRPDNFLPFGAQIAEYTCTATTLRLNTNPALSFRKAQ